MLPWTCSPSAILDFLSFRCLMKFAGSRVCELPVPLRRLRWKQWQHTCSSIRRNLRQFLAKKGAFFVLWMLKPFPSSRKNWIGLTPILAGLIWCRNRIWADVIVGDQDGGCFTLLHLWKSEARLCVWLQRQRKATETHSANPNST